VETQDFDKRCSPYDDPSALETAFYILTGYVVITYMYFSLLSFSDITSMLDSGDPGRLGTHIYVFTVESQEPVGARHTSCTQLLWKPHGPCGEDAPIYLVTFETRDSWGQGTLHICSYCGNPAIRAGKARTFK
jgi:hypothetical protein